MLHTSEWLLWVGRSDFTECYYWAAQQLWFQSGKETFGNKPTVAWTHALTQRHVGTHGTQTIKEPRPPQCFIGFNSCRQIPEIWWVYCSNQIARTAASPSSRPWWTSHSLFSLWLFMILKFEMQTLLDFYISSWQDNTTSGPCLCKAPQNLCALFKHILKVSSSVPSEHVEGFQTCLEWKQQLFVNLLYWKYCLHVSKHFRFVSQRVGRGSEGRSLVKDKRLSRGHVQRWGGCLLIKGE